MKAGPENYFIFILLLCSLELLQLTFGITKKKIKIKKDVIFIILFIYLFLLALEQPFFLPQNLHFCTLHEQHFPHLNTTMCRTHPSEESFRPLLINHRTSGWFYSLWIQVGSLQAIPTFTLQLYGDSHQCSAQEQPGCSPKPEHISSYTWLWVYAREHTHNTFSVDY